MTVEIIRTLGFAIISPILLAYTAIKIAEFHFKKEIKTRYLTAKERTAIDILNNICLMLTSMWEIVNINNWISSGAVTNNDPNINQRRQTALDNFQRATRESYLQLGLMGLYYGTEIVEPVAQLQSDLNTMIQTNNFDDFNNWDNFRRERLLPILQRVHIGLKTTVFEKPKSFRLIVD